MYLKRVELLGFKSFADRTELEFVPGVTAVVGPNGSGKSNVSDAIRWVLGEQSAKSLRGAKMEDIIFAGSDNRKPLNYGEVSLTLDNSCETLPLDFSEITVTRRVYRSGESEYYINRQQCRLKDITELFMDTGLGKEAYSIIGQGRIEEILSTKSEDRRGIFEEAAGIVKYKSRKREAQKKLEETEANLLRITDIISEIDEQIEPLKEQADTARTYKNLKDELMGKEIGLYVYNIEQIHNTWQESQQKVNVLSEKQLSIAAEVNSRDALIEQKRWNLNQLDKELENLQHQLLDNVQELEKLEGRRQVLREREKNAHENRLSFAEKMERLLQKKEALTIELQKEVSERDQLLEQLESVTKNLREEEGKWDGINQRLEGNLEKLKADYIELLGEIATARNERKNVEHQISLHRQRLTRFQGDEEREQESISTYYQQIEKCEAALAKIRQQIEETLTNYREWTLQQQELKGKAEQITQALRQKERIRNQLGSRLELLKEMQADFTGFMQGVKEILKVRDTELKGIHGAVAELITVPQKYETAIEIALGGALQHVVVEEERFGREAIAYLKKHHLGRATFLPISVMKGRHPSPGDVRTLQQEKGVFGLASELVSFDNLYRGVVENLLGSVVVVESLEIANHVARLVGYRYRIVTLDGDVVNPGGSMTGGTIKQKSTNLLGRGRAIEEIELEWQQAGLDYKKLATEQERNEQELIKISEHLNEYKAKGESLRLQEQELVNELTRYETEYKNMEQRLNLLQHEQKIFQEEAARLEKQFNEIVDTLAALERKEVELKLTIELADQSKKEQENTREEMSAKITELKVVVAETRQMLESKNEVIARLQGEMEEIDREREQQDHDLKQLFSLLEENEDLEKVLEEEIEASKQQKLDLTQLIETKRVNRLTTQQELEKAENSTKEFRKQLRQVEEELHKEEVKVNRSEVELDNLLEKLREDYELTYEAAKAEYKMPSQEEIDGLRREVFRLKRDIVGLGDVNLGAIEEYERLKERYEFLTSQSEDLLTAKQSLYQVIQEMDEEMTRRFADSFSQIRSQFQVVFQQLFGGGRADLILTDPDDLLDTGIDIVAQPPGKKLQNLALLSGGERALTAIALLFAILRVRPVPFCVLDEVEAALDEANVSRFAQYLKEFSSQTQFIVITHRKGTMEGADVLYGVTMEGAGVSKLVSVKLEELEQGQGIA